MFKKVMLLGAALAAMVAIAAPAAQAEWIHSNGNPLVGNATISLDGKAKFETVNGGAEGTLTANLELTGGTSTAHVKNVTVDGCKTFGGLGSLFCTATPAGPWVAHTISGTNTILITNISLTNHYWTNSAHTGSPVLTTTLTGNVLATVDNAGGISNVTSLKGEGTHVGGNAATVSGELAVTSGAGTYGFE